MSPIRCCRSTAVCPLDKRAADNADYPPAIGRSTRADNLFYAFRHQHSGLTPGPVTGALMAAMPTGDAPAVDPAPFDRF